MNKIGIVRLTEGALADQRWSRLSRGEMTPFSERGGAVLFEEIAAVEVAVLIEDPMGTDRDPLYRVVSHHDPLEATMSSIEHISDEQAAVGNDLSAIFVSLELSRSTWLITSLSPGGGEKMSKHQVRSGDMVASEIGLRAQRTE